MEERNIMGELDMYRQLGLKSNFSEIGRRYGLDRHTVARYWNEGGDVDDGRCSRPSGQIRVTVAGELVAGHDASRGTGKFNYTEGHYAKALQGKGRYSDSGIKEAARENLRLLDGMGGIDGRRRR